MIKVTNRGKNRKRKKSTIKEKESKAYKKNKQNRDTKRNLKNNLISK